MTTPQRQIGTLLVSCPDRRGIVAGLAQVLYGHGANIIDSDQHTDVGCGHFFQRIRFDMSEAHADPLTLERALAELAERFEMQSRVTYSGVRKKVALFVSRTDHCLYDILLRHRAGELECDLRVVISNHDTLRPVAESFGLPYHHIPVTAETRAEGEDRQLALLAEHDIDLVVLARYMQVLSARIIEPYRTRIINIHHSFLPAFVGSKPYHQAQSRGVKLIGATAHYVTEDLDEGPIIEQDVARCSHRDTVDDLVRKGRDLEKLVLARAVRSHLQDRVLTYQNKTVVFE